MPPQDNLQTNSEAKAKIYAQYKSDLQRSIRLAMRLCRSEPDQDSNDDHDQRATNLKKAV